MTPPGSIGSAYRYVAALVVFDGQLYAGLAHGDTGQGAEIWRTADGLAWTRVVQNGFANDVYNTDALSLAVYNGNLYAGTRHGDWHADEHADGPLGGEVWRSSDGTTWTRVNNPGFGNLEAHRVESLQVFQSGLYAYVSHVGGSAAGADVWRCTKTICSEQSDWTQVSSNGFGVSQNQYLYAGAVSGGYLYAAVYNATTGVQLWRTANGVQWEKATPYDGLGNSNNSHVNDGAMTVFNGRLTLGIYNGASGAGVWQKTLTADFAATPTRGAPPLAVQFANTSSGDFTTSQWDFGDGGTSTAISPTHTYMAAGTYTVTLTVGDGTDTSTITKANAIRVGYASYLPMVMRNYDPLLYDNFDDPAWEGTYNPAKWQFGGNNAFQAQQQGGVLVFSGGNGLPAGQGANLKLRPLTERSLTQLGVFEARVKISSAHTSGWAQVALFVSANNIAGHRWWTQCVLGSSAGSQQPNFRCDVTTYVGAVPIGEYGTVSTIVNYDTWYLVRIAADPATATLRFYLDGKLIDNYTPKDATALISANNFQPEVGIWNGDANTSATRYVDDVRITPAR